MVRLLALVLNGEDETPATVPADPERALRVAVAGVGFDFYG